MPSHIVIPETTRYELSNGDWMLVKSRLNAGEYRRMMGRMMGTMSVTPGQTALVGMTVDPMNAGINLILAHLLDWSLVDPSGAQMVLRDPLTGDRVAFEKIIAFLDAIDIETYTEIESLVQAHYDRTRKGEKKTGPSAPSLPKTLPSPDAATGDTNGSPSSTLMSTTFSSTSS